MVEVRRGDQLLEGFEFSSRLRDSAVIVELAHIEREAMKAGYEGPRGRSLTALSKGDRRHCERFRAMLTRGNAQQIESDAFRALCAVLNETGQLRVGLQKVDRQTRSAEAAHREGLWLANEIPTQGVRGRGTRAREAALMLGVSKLITNQGVFDGPTRHLFPRKPIAPDVVDLIRSVSRVSPAITVLELRVDELLDGRAFANDLERVRAVMAPGGPRTLVLPLDPSRGPDLILEDGRQSPLVPLLIRRDGWEATREIVKPGGSLGVSVAAPTPLAGAAPGKRLVMRLASVRILQESGPPLRPRAYGVFGQADAGQALELVADTFERDDNWPPIDLLLRAREEARVHRGECRDPQTLHADRAVASLALNAALLDDWVPARRPAAARY
jgi:hypothetical protein